MPGVLSETIQKQEDPASRLEALLNRHEPELVAAFLEVARQLRGSLALDQLVTLVEQGRVQEALEVAAQAGARFATTVNGVYIAAGLDTASRLTNVLRVSVDFDVTNAGAVRAMQETRLRLVREISSEQALAARQALAEGVRAGLNPRRQAQALRDSLGLTARQVSTVTNFRRMLEEGDREVLRRALRDRRFDPTVRRRLATGEPLTARQVDRMVARYRERQLRARAEMVARTEALRAVNGAAWQTYEQAYERGLIDPARVEEVWRTAADTRVRDSHRTMNGQTRQPGQPFLSGAGNALRFPGDPEAPASEVVQCRCVVARFIR